MTSTFTKLPKDNPRDIPAHDEILITYPNDTTEVYTYRNSGVSVYTLTLVYTDKQKTDLVSITKTRE